MKIKTAFDIGQTIYLVSVTDRMERGPCPICDGAGKITATDKRGDTHTVDCPAASYYSSHRPLGFAACHHGKVDIAMGSVFEIRSDMVGQVRVEVGGLSCNTNMSDHDDQTFKREESVMCYGTGIGSGNLFYVGEGHGGTRIFATEEEARTWAEEEVAVRDALRLQENTALGVDSEDGVPGGNEPPLRWWYTLESR